MRKTEKENLLRVKRALMDKYQRKAHACNSKPGKAAFLRRAERYRRQVEDVQRASRPALS